MNWIDYKAYLSVDNLMSYIESVFSNYGSVYSIDFSDGVLGV